MIVKDLMNTSVISVLPDDSISAALSKMKQNRVHQLPVIDKELKGILVLKKIITKDIDPSLTKVGSLMLPATVLSPEMDVRGAAEKILLSGFRALPVVKNDIVIGVLSETDLMRAVGGMNLKYDVDSIRVECDVASVNDDLGRVKKIMAYKNVSRVPVIKNGRIVGSVESMNLIDILMKKEPMQGGGLLKEKGTKEKISIDKTLVTSVMKDATIVDNKTPITKAAELLATKEELFVEDSGRFYVITPKDVTELIAKGEVEGVYVQIANLGDVDAMTNAKIENNVTKFVQKMGRIIQNLHSFVVHVERHEKGGRTRYDIRTRLLTPMGLYVSKSTGWKLLDVFQDVMNNLEREILKKHGKMMKREEAKKAKQMRRE